MSAIDDFFSWCSHIKSGIVFELDHLAADAFDSAGVGEGAVELVGRLFEGKVPSNLEGKIKDRVPLMLAEKIRIYGIDATFSVATGNLEALRNIMIDAMAEETSLAINISSALLEKYGGFSSEASFSLADSMFRCSSQNKHLLNQLINHDFSLNRSGLLYVLGEKLNTLPIQATKKIGQELFERFIPSSDRNFMHALSPQLQDECYGRIIPVLGRIIQSMSLDQLNQLKVNPQLAINGLHHSILSSLSKEYKLVQKICKDILINQVNMSEQSASKIAQYFIPSQQDAYNMLRKLIRSDFSIDSDMVVTILADKIGKMKAIDKFKIIKDAELLIQYIVQNHPELLKSIVQDNMPEDMNKEQKEAAFGCIRCILLAKDGKDCVSRIQKFMKNPESLKAIRSYIQQQLKKEGKEKYLVDIENFSTEDWIQIVNSVVDGDFSKMRQNVLLTGNIDNIYDKLVKNIMGTIILKESVKIWENMTCEQQSPEIDNALSVDAKTIKNSLYKAQVKTVTEENIFSWTNKLEYIV